MFHLVLQRILHKKWMVASLLIGNILLIAIAVSNPMYQDATRRRMLTDQFGNYLEANNTYPMLIRSEGLVRKKGGRAAADKLREYVDDIPSMMGLDAVADVNFLRMIPDDAISLNYHKGKDPQKVALGALRDLEDHITMLSGNAPSPTRTGDGFIEVIISQGAMVRLNLVVGEEIEFKNLKLSEDENVKARVVGIYTYSDAADPYWTDGPDTYSDSVMLNYDLFLSMFSSEGKVEFQYNDIRLLLLDYTQLRPEAAADVLAKTKEMAATYDSIYSSIPEPDYTALIEKFLSEENRIVTTLAILQVPVLVLLCAFIFMISRQMLEMEENEIALLKSRGASKRQVLTMYLMQSFVLSGISFVIGIPLGALVCKILGASSAFLKFDSPRSLSVELNKEVFVYALIAVVVSMLMTLLPVFKRDKVSIVAVKRKKSRSDKPLWKKLYLDVIIFGVSLYGFYSFNNRQDELLLRVLSGQSLDPLLFLSSSLFILGAGLISLRIQNLLVKIIYGVGKKGWKPAEYTSFLQLIRTGNKQAFIMVFLILTVAFGMFNTTVARTILANAENNTEYVHGADIVETEYWKNNASFVATDPTLELVYTEPDFTKYIGLNAKGIAKVFENSKASAKLSGSTVNADIMGIDTKSFGETAKMKDGLLTYNFYEYLNVLSTNPDAILLSSNFKNKYGVKIGDRITYSIDDGAINGSNTAVVYGFFDYWPGYRPSVVNIMEDNSTAVEEKYLIVAHLSTIQEKIGVYPYKVWINMDGDTERFYTFATDEKMMITSMSDAVRAKEEIAAEPLFQGTNGILTMSFITVLLICAIGYVIYWMLSIKSRELLFGIFRAMGMSRKEVIRMLINEQVFTGVFGIAFGLLIGYIASVLYVPIIQIAYSASDRVLPLELITKGSDIVRLLIIIALMFAVCLGILINQVFKMKISQALKLGED
ncbi:MAG: FtsX-like permease family protein [Lachnospiraceae bacterium]|nr:FtsX-like permease family protein [Lachnospiraceae bacterium]